MTDFLKSLWRRIRGVEEVAVRTMVAPEKTRIIAGGYEGSSWPMLPREVVNFAVDNGWAFDGNIGPQVILDPGLFAALGKGKSARAPQEGDEPETAAQEAEAEAMSIAHTAYDYYLRFPERARAAARGEIRLVPPDEFWRGLLKKP